MTRGVRTLLAAPVLLTALTGKGEADSMLYENAVVWTGDPGRPWAQALWVEDGVLRGVGSRSDLQRIVAKDVERVDLGGAFVCPGLVDAHAHVMGFGLGLDRVNLVGSASLEETLGRIATQVALMRAEEFDGWVQGRGWDQNDWPETDFPGRGDLDRVTGDFPAWMVRIDGHAAWVNSAALRAAGITAETPDPAGGRILRDSDGSPSGILVDNAMELVQGLLPEPDFATRRRGVLRAAEAMARVGLTGAHDMGMTAAELEVYRDLATHRAIGVRVYAALSALDPDLDRLMEQGPDREWRGGCFKLGMVKFYMDGALGSRGAALLAPYSDEPGNSGLLILDEETLCRQLPAALEHGFQAAVHAIGDRANRAVIDCWEDLHLTHGVQPHEVPGAPLSLIGRVPAQLPPVRLEHAQIIAPEDLDRVASLGILASMQPTHCTSDMPWAPRRLGEARMEGAYAWRSLVDRGAVLASGSDFPVESHDPRYGIYAAVTRRQPDGTPAEGWSPQERLGREEALVSFTAAPAYASGDLHRRGTLTVGKDADFSVFDVNLVTCDPEDILEARCLLTVVGGETLWKEPRGFSAGGGEK